MLQDSAIVSLMSYNFDSSIKYSTKSLNMLRRVYADLQNHEHIIVALKLKGDVFFSKAAFRDGSREVMRCTLQFEFNAHAIDTVPKKNNAYAVDMACCCFGEAEQIICKSTLLYEQCSGEDSDNHYIAKNLGRMGHLAFSKCDSSNATVWFSLALGMHTGLYCEELDHLNIARSLQNLGQASKVRILRMPYIC